MLPYTIQSTDIICEDDMYDMIDLFNDMKPRVGAFDTETTGLHIICDVPFLFQFGWIDRNNKTIYTYTVDLELRPILANRTINMWHAICKELEIYAGHNVSYDMHMTHNVNLPYIEPNLRDSQHYIRLAHDNIPTRSGGVDLALKSYAKNYIDIDAKAHDQLLQRERTAIASKYNKELQKAFNNTGIIPDGYRSWTVAAIKDKFKDPTFMLDDLEEELQEAYLTWKDTLPKQIADVVIGRVTKDDVPYNLLDRANVTKYGHMDIVYTIAVVLKCEQVLIDRGNSYALDIESKLIPVFFDMERQGFYADKEYLQESKLRLRNYIRERRSKLNAVAGRHFTISQSKVIKEICNSKFNLNVSSTGAEVFDQLLNEVEGEAKQFIELVQELRTLEKWYYTYLTRLEHSLARSPKLYTQINSVGTASGRVTSDFQQFPKGGIATVEGFELFNPRRMVTITPGYRGIVYMDYSQIELRVQALYTIILGEGDLNLCRSYMPYRCYRLNEIHDGVHGQVVTFDPNNPDHIKDWRGDWYHEEDDKPWIPVDLHGATTKAAFGIDEGHPNFKKLRGYGKRVNFAKNYGATYNRIKQMFPEFSEDEVRRIDGAYYQAFPGIRIYQDYCYRLAEYQAYATNLFNIRYWNVSGHNLINMLIQGSSAYFLKLKEIAIFNYLKETGRKSKMQMNIHDEISFLWHPDDPVEMFLDIQAIMEEWDDAPVPIVADLEITTTNWADKEDWTIE